jgi:molybdopterin-containing oxidoreductase family membrane subunit
MSDLGGVVGSFEHLDSLLDALRAVKQAGYENLEVFSPTPRHEIDHAVGRKKSPVRYLTYAGALFGMGLAFALTILSSLVWNMIVGGKAIISLVPFMVPVFELTILFGGIATLLAILYFSNLPSRRSPGYQSRFSDDRFGLYVTATVGQCGELRQLFCDHHAETCTVLVASSGER